MKKIYITTILLIFINFSVYSNENNTLTIYTYDSFVSKWGPGPIIKKRFEEKYNININFVALDSAATLLNKVILEGSSTKADIILGLDMNLFDEAKESKLFSDHYLKISIKKLIYQLNGIVKNLFHIITVILLLFIITKF